MTKKKSFANTVDKAEIAKVWDVIEAGDLTNAEVATLWGVSEGTVERWLAGRMGMSGTARRITEVYRNNTQLLREEVKGVRIKHTTNNTGDVP